jgi:hypothetical protein
MRNFISRATMGAVAISAIGSSVGCTVQPADAEDIASVAEEPLFTGNWSGDIGTPGSPGDDPFIDPTLVARVPCEVYSTGDTWWHPGKLWEGKCSIAWGSGVYASPSYRALQRAPSGFQYQWVQYVGGFTPPNAVVSSSTADAGKLPVCKAGDLEQTLGKLWQGRCEFEWAGHRFPSNIQVSVLVQVSAP